MALNYPQLIHGAVKRAGIWRGSQDYEDFVQEAYFAFAYAYQEFPGEPATDPTFLNFAFNSIIWRLTDLLRYQQRRQCDDLAEQFSDNFHLDFEAGSVTALTLRDYIKSATTMDRLIIWNHFICEQPLTQIAREHHLSPRTLRARRARLRDNFAQILDYHF